MAQSLTKLHYYESDLMDQVLLLSEGSVPVSLNFLLVLCLRKRKTVCSVNEGILSPETSTLLPVATELVGPRPA
jgi:hypothetical protein